MGRKPETGFFLPTTAAKVALKAESLGPHAGGPGLTPTELAPPEVLHRTSPLALEKSDRLANSWRQEEV